MLVVSPLAAAGSCVWVYDEVALGIVAACTSDGIHEALGIGVDGLQRLLDIVGVVGACGGWIVPAAVGIEHLVVALEEQRLAVVLECLGNLLPELLEPRLVGSIVVGVGLDPVVARQLSAGILAVGARVVMDVQDAV